MDDFDLSLLAELKLDEPAPHDFGGDTPAERKPKVGQSVQVVSGDHVEAGIILAVVEQSEVLVDGDTLPVWRCDIAVLTPSAPTVSGPRVVGLGHLAGVREANDPRLTWGWRYAD